MVKVISLTRRRSLAPCRTSAVADVSVDMMASVYGGKNNDQIAIARSCVEAIRRKRTGSGLQRLLTRLFNCFFFPSSPFSISAQKWIMIDAIIIRLARERRCSAGLLG